jgi:hypothetical protein
VGQGQLIAGRCQVCAAGRDLRPADQPALHPQAEPAALRSPRRLRRLLRAGQAAVRAPADRTLPTFEYVELVARDKVNLDLIWLRDDSLKDSDILPAPAVIAREIVADLEAALAEFAAIADALESAVDKPIVNERREYDRGRCREATGAARSDRLIRRYPVRVQRGPAVPQWCVILRRTWEPSTPVRREPCARVGSQPRSQPLRSMIERGRMQHQLRSGRR